MRSANILPPIITNSTAALRMHNEDLQRETRNLRRRVEFLESVIDTLRQRHPELFAQC